MNNQTAMLRVVENNVYFTVNSTVVPCTAVGCTNSFVSYTTTVNTVPIGFTMSVTPQINARDSVLLNVRPSITRLVKNANDPTPGLFNNFVPQTSTREMESMLKIENNQIAVLGGMMEDRVEKLTDEVPFLAGIPIIGNLFQNRNDTTSKTELVIFLRPVVIKDASIEGDYREFRDSLPDQNFFKEPTNNLLQNQ
jgi:MSHA biogenesis protein MshL